MKVRMLMTVPGESLFPGERLMRGSEYEVPDHVGEKWIGRLIAEPAPVVAVDHKAEGDTTKRPRRPTNQE